MIALEQVLCCARCVRFFVVFVDFTSPSWASIVANICLVIMVAASTAKNGHRKQMHT